MQTLLKESIWKQFGAGIEMLENAITFCPLAYWNAASKFWYLAYHTLFFLDYYTTLQPKGFKPPPPFTLSEFGDGLPERIYTQEELLTYLQYNREKLFHLMSTLKEEDFQALWINESGTMNYTVLEILLYNMRHVQHHTAQLNLLLRQQINDAPPWVRHGEVSL